jgi:hypothetical protein
MLLDNLFQSTDPAIDSYAAPILPVDIIIAAGRRQAVAQIRKGVIEVQVPRHWSKDVKDDLSRQLIRRVQKEFERDFQLVQQNPGPFISFDPKKPDLSNWVNKLNDETVRVPVKKVRIGSSKYTQLAQMNIRSHVMTVSRFCITDVPERALRYLIVHELSHLIHADHSKSFWNLVAQFVPDYRNQRRVIAAFHRMRLYEADRVPIVKQTSLFDMFR